MVIGLAALAVLGSFVERAAMNATQQPCVSGCTCQAAESTAGIADRAAPVGVEESLGVDGNPLPETDFAALNQKLEPQAETVTEPALVSLVSLGEFKIYHYAPTGSRTASGTVPEVGRTIAVDPSVIPLGSVVVIDGHEYRAEDTGGAIKGHVIDVFVTDAAIARQMGVRYAEVSVYRP
jgi:3D (Asp-Asp-Asp) domain-containing protein